MERKFLLPPHEVRFTEPADVEKYGDGWYVYDELAWVTKAARDLVPIELEIGAPLTTAMDGFRESSVFGDNVAAWLAVRAAGKDVAWADFQPAIMLAEWRQQPLPDLGKGTAEDLGQADSAPTSSGTTAMDTVSLPIMPPVE
jgi:hypothetical protein